jgi:hypothetical protein
MSSEANSLPFDPAEPNSMIDRRVWVRYRCAHETSGQTFNTTNYTSQHGRVLNLSSGGIGLLLNWAVAPGTLLKVEIKGWNGNRMLLGRVIHASRQTDGWLHGCELANPVTATEIEDLLA